MPFFGEAVALVTVLCWTLSIQFFEAASKRVGSTPVNIIRLFVALLFFSVFLLIRDGSIIPTDFSARAWFYMSLSGIVGFFIGDLFLFRALVDIGPRVTMLIQSLAAPTSAIIGWVFLGESYLLRQWAGIIVTLIGVSIVVLERANKEKVNQKYTVREISLKGVVFALIAMFGQAGGLVLSKAGMATDSGYLDAFSATQIRAIAAFICFVLFFTFTHKWRNVRSALNDKKAVAFTSIGAFVGPFLGVSLSLLALHYLPTGVAATVLSLVPIFIIPFSVFLHKEHVSLRAVVGALVAVFGVFLLVY